MTTGNYTDFSVLKCHIFCGIMFVVSFNKYLSAACDDHHPSLPRAVLGLGLKIPHSRKPISARPKGWSHHCQVTSHTESWSSIWHKWSKFQKRLTCFDQANLYFKVLIVIRLHTAGPICSKCFISVAKLQKEPMELQLNSTIRKKLSKLKMK